MLRTNDSLLVKQVQQKDSGIMAYLHSVNNIQHSIDTLMMDARVLKNVGNVVGLGRIPVIDQAMNIAGLHKADLTQLKEIPLGGNLVKLVTVHPYQSYKTMGGISDKLIITDPQDFWSKSKYLVVIVD